ncbi:hypothetical protein ACFQFC_11040 [Amorphoplanes digitatis]|uniref:Lipoprotein n=1 Tax=Actinoplanes digitatis TaxID=1868 RepID=A0A7W7I1W5_9ACTN|nr:hypothetical protein [Actinoplanes digitatis]MBB4764733.1 hypothetical protein [Actinoplanes digitatis]BFE74287.1 hypothetical protein GCM10020092_075880 [Actinoplanes digitatis]GID91314.1 hypothetical protein Adi01nite_07260 [Actinoplanes digitatis]
MRSFVSRPLAAPLATLLGGALVLGGCSASDPAPPAPVTKPSASAAPAVRLATPAKINGLPRTEEAKRLKGPESMTESFKRSVLRPTDSVAAVYLNPKDLSEMVEVSAAAGQVATPDVALRLLTQNLAVQLEDVRPIDLGVAGAVGRCGVDRANRPLVITMCHWAEPGSVGSINIWSSKDRRDDFADIRALIRPPA